MTTPLSTSPTTRSLRATAALLLALALLSGCGGGTTQGGAAAAASTTPSATAATTPAPGMEVLWPYYPHAHEQQLIDEARAVLLTGCMNDHGSPLQTPVAVGKLEKRLAAEQEEQSVLYGITDRDLVRQFGYSPSLALLAPAPAPPPDAVQPSPLPVHTEVQEPVDIAPGSTEVESTPSEVVTACIQQAQADLYGGKKYVGTDPFGLGRDLAIRAWLDSREDREVQTVWGEWRACMQRAGYEPAGDPVDPRLFLVRTDGSAAPAAEVKAALTDIDCKNETEFVSRWAAVVRQLEDAALERKRAELEAQQSHLEATLAKARELIAE